MAYFAGYGFNKSHSAAYALIAYHTAYLKAHYPREFMASLISSETSDPEKLTYYLQKTRELDINLKPPSINYSNIDFTATADTIVFGLQGIKNVGHAALDNIITERNANGPFTDFLEFCQRVDLRTVNKRVIESLICAGAFDELEGNRAQKMESLETVMSLANQAKEAAKTGQMGLFGEILETGSAKHQPYSFDYLEEWPLKDRLEKEKAVAGFYLSAHPLDSYKPLINALNANRFADLLANPQPIMDENEGVAIGMGLMQSYKVITTTKGDKMAFVELEDFSGPCEVIVFPKLFAVMEQQLEANNIFMVKGQLDITGRNKAKIKAEKMIPAQLLLTTPKTFGEIVLDFKANISKERLELAKNLLTNGTMRTLVKFQENNRTFIVGTTQKATITHENLIKLDQAGIDVQLILN
jgi:DNA polymerase-3 subunit alpha